MHVPLLSVPWIGLELNSIFTVLGIIISGVSTLAIFAGTIAAVYSTYEPATAEQTRDGIYLMVVMFVALVATLFLGAWLWIPIFASLVGLGMYYLGRAMLKTVHFAFFSEAKSK
jgi:hypothetical protein